MSRIQEIRSHVFRLPLRGSLAWGKHSELRSLEHVLVQARSDSGHESFAEAPVRPTIYGETVQSIQALVENYLAPGLEGLELSDLSQIEEVLGSVANNHTARGALDIALTGLRAQATGTNLFESEHGPHLDPEVSFILGIADPQTMMAEARRIYEAGVRVFKVKIGRDFDADAKVLRALRHEFTGSPVELYADANQTLTPETAAHTLEKLRDLGVAWVEEPLAVHLLRERAALKQLGIVPLIADDSCFTLSDLTRELAFDTFDILNIKPARTGFTESKKMLDLARAAAKGVMVGSQASSGLGTLHAAIFASKDGVSHPSELSFPLKLERDSLERSFRYQEGRLDLSGGVDLRLSPTLGPLGPR